MWRKKKFIIGVQAAIVILAGSLGGVALAQSGDESNPDSFLDRVVIKLNEQGVSITTEQLQDAFKQAGKDMRAEARDRHFDTLVEKGIITEDEAAQLKEWLEARPDISIEGAPFDEFGMPSGNPFGGRVRFRIGPFPGISKHGFFIPPASAPPSN